MPGRHALAVVDATLSGAPAAFAEANRHDAPRRADGRPALGPGEIGIDNFAFGPRELAVPSGTAVTWINRDDVPHVIASAQGRFPSSPVLDTNKRFTFRFAERGTYDYFCSIHPTMTGRIVVS
nr:cupredoxin family copper-binding protein [Gemmatirosa kalamazoonensis]